MKVRYKEYRTILTGDYENIKIEYEIEMDGIEKPERTIITEVRNTLNSLELEIREKKEEKEFQTIVNKWIQQQDSELRFSKVKTLLDFYGVKKLRFLPIAYHEEFVCKMMGENDE